MEARTMTPYDPPITLPEPDTIRAAIDATDERARLLRRLLRLAMRFRLPLMTASDLPTNAAGPFPCEGVKEVQSS
jgi:hypothetical protein